MVSPFEELNGGNLELKRQACTTRVSWFVTECSRAWWCR